MMLTEHQGYKPRGLWGWVNRGCLSKNQNGAVIQFVREGYYANPGQAGLWGEGTTESGPQAAMSEWSSITLFWILLGTLIHSTC